MIFEPFASAVLAISSLAAATAVPTPVHAYDAGGAATAAVFGLAAGAMVGAAAEVLLPGSRRRRLSPRSDPSGLRIPSSLQSLG